MTPRIDEQVAWALVRALDPRAPTPGGSVRVEVGDGVFVDVDRHGRWRTSAEVEAAGAQLLDIYLPLRSQPRLVIGQLGQSLDGRIATEGGQSHFVTGSEDLDRLHRVRALVDAVVVGAETAVADNPRLTVRRVEGDQPVRVVLDPSRRVGLDLHVRSDGAARTLLVRRRTDGGTDAELQGDELRVPSADHGGLALDALLHGLETLGLKRVLVEGGGVTVSRFLQARLLDRLHVCIAPMLIGSGRPSVTLDAIDHLDEALRPRCRHFTLGRDVLFDLDLRSEA